MQTTKASSTESAIWGRLLGPEGTTLSAEAARGVLAIDFPQADKDRLRELAAKARQGTLSPEEQDEIDAYGRIGSFLSVMKSKVGGVESFMSTRSWGSALTLLAEGPCSQWGKIEPIVPSAG